MSGSQRGPRPVGYFVHHQGRGHAERAADIANALIATRPVTVFCARDDIFPALDRKIELIRIPSLFEHPGGEDAPVLANQETPDTLHCAPLGWSTITDAVARITQWFARERPALFVTDVSAELGQLARIASVPHCAVMQHGRRDDPGHVAAYRSAVALLAPYSARLEQKDRPSWMREKTIYASGIGVKAAAFSTREAARKKLGIDPGEPVTVVIGGGGGSGLPSAPLTLAARAEPASRWYTLGKIASEWHETPPGNLHHRGWVDNPHDWIAASDRVVSSCGNTTVHMVASAGKPWIVVPEWRYFAEQVCKADALEQAGVAAVSMQWPSCAAEWKALFSAADAIDPADQRAITHADAAGDVAKAIENLIARIWAGARPVDAVDCKETTET